MKITESDETRLVKDYFANLKAEVTSHAASILSKDLEKVNPKKYSRICSDRQMLKNKIDQSEFDCLSSLQTELKRNQIINGSDSNEDGTLRAALANKQLFFAGIKFKEDDNCSFGILVRVNQFISKRGQVLLKNELKKYSPVKSLDENVGTIFRQNTEENNNNALLKLTNENLKIWFLLKKLYETVLHPDFDHQLYHEIDINEFYTLRDVNLYCKNFTHISSRALNETLVRQANFKMLSFFGNGIKTISLDAFSTLNNLEILNLEHNQLESIEATLFDSLFNLKELYLSNNQLKHIDAKAFDKLDQLEVLTLFGYGNSFKYKPNMFKSLRSLKELKLAGVVGAELDMLDEMTNLTSLYLDNVFGEQALNETIYKNLVNLEEFLLQNSRVKEIKANFLSKQLKLKKLTIQDTRLDKIDRRAFHHLTQLENVWLLSCNLRYMDRGCFKGLEKIEKIDLSYNQFSEEHVFGFDGIDESKVFNM